MSWQGYSYKLIERFCQLTQKLTNSKTYKLKNLKT